MTRLQVVHHTDYRSKAEDRKKELQKLEEKGLAKIKAARLRDAQVPTEACNFLEKQRELFALRRKKKADAVKFLHRFRADDDFVLRRTRHSLGSQKEKYPASRNTTYRYSLSPSRLHQKREPDARASVYSYVVYPGATPRTGVSIQQDDDSSHENSSLELAIHPADIIQNSIGFESLYKTFEGVAKEEARSPLPEDKESFIVENKDDDDREDNSGDLISGKNVSIFTDQSSTAPFIPSEAFSKLGGSMAMIPNGIADCKDNDICKSITKYDSDDESIIPAESFIQLGASMVANNLCSSRVEQKATRENEMQQGKEEMLYTISNTITHSSTSQIDKTSMPLEQSISKTSNHSVCERTDFDFQKSECKGIIKGVAVASVNNLVQPNTILCEEDELSRTEVIVSTDFTRRSTIQNKKSFERKVGSESANNLEVSVQSRTATGDDVCQINITPKKSNLVAHERKNEAKHCVDGTSEYEEKMMENETYHRENIETTNCEALRKTERDHRRNQKKKKNVGKSYYPSTSLFLSRHIFGR